MTFIQSFPTISLLLGNAKTDLLDEHSQELPNTSFEEIKRHQEECSEGEWCKLNTGQLCQNELINIEAILAQILKSPNINDEKLRRAFSSMAKNPDQFEQLRAEIVTAATAESRATLLDLDWKTGKKDYDADVRMEINDEPVNLEVTLRTDNWLKAITVHMEDIIDEQGNQINKPLGAKSRRTLTDLERSDSEESGIKSPIRVESMMSPLKQSPRQIQFISNSEGIPEGEQQKTYYIDGDEPRVESSSVANCIQSKAKKFKPDGFHIVVLATIRPGFPSESSVSDAVFGQSEEIKYHGLFESGLYNQICGVIFLPVYQHIDRLLSKTEEPSLVRYFVNHNAEIKPSDKLQSAIADVFEAEIKFSLFDKGRAE